MINLPWETWLRLLLWMAIGIVVYWKYGRWNGRGQRMVSEDEDRTDLRKPAIVPRQPELTERAIERRCLEEACTAPLGVRLEGHT